MRYAKLISSVELKRLISHNFTTEYGMGENENNFDYIYLQKNNKERKILSIKSSL